MLASLFSRLNLNVEMSPSSAPNRRKSAPDPITFPSSIIFILYPRTSIGLIMSNSFPETNFFTPDGAKNTNDGGGQGGTLTVIDNSPDSVHPNDVTRFSFGRHYVRYFNYKYHRTGTLWEGRYHSSLVQQECYLLACQRYIELNPVRANMVTDPADYEWSSYRTNALGIRSKILTPHPVYLSLGNTKASRLCNYRALFGSSIDKDLLFDIRYSLNKGLVLGTEQFKTEVEAMTGRRVRPTRRVRERP